MALFVIAGDIAFPTSSFAGKHDSASVTGNTSSMTLSQFEGDILLSAGISRAPDLAATVPPPLQFDVSDGLTLFMTHPFYRVDSAKLPSNPELQILWGATNRERNRSEHFRGSDLLWVLYLADC